MTDGSSIYEHVRAHLDPAGRLEEGGRRLPDEDKVTGRGIRWVAGALDGAFGHHGGGGQDPERRASEIVRLLRKAAKKPSERALRNLYVAVAESSAMDYVDPLAQLLAVFPADFPAVHPVGRWLATAGADREAVKLGIALIGITGRGEDLDVLRALGAHDEFTLYVVVALRRCLQNPDSEIWALASAVDGWGRVQCVERLRDTTDPTIQAWILREGFRNTIMAEYLAYIAATTGGLLAALQRDEVDRETLTAAGEILDALIRGGPAEDIDDYADGADAVEAYLRHMQARAETLVDHESIAAIRLFLAAEDEWDARSTSGWTTTRREAFEAACDEILGRPEWDDRIAVALLSDDRGEFWRGDWAARRRGIDTFDLHVAKIRDDPFGTHWSQAWAQAGDGAGDRAEVLAELVRSLLPLHDIASGAADEVGMGPEWRPHMSLDWTLQALRNHIGVGGDLLLVGMQSPVTRNRVMALAVLNAWPRFAWPAGAADSVRYLAGADPYLKARAQAAELVASRLSGD